MPMNQFLSWIEGLDGWEFISVETIEQEIMTLIAEFQLTLELVEAHYAA